MSAPRLDDWLADASVRIAHHREAAVDAATLWAAAQRVTLDDTRVLGQLVRWRIPGLADDLRYLDLFRAAPFVVLDERPDALVSGLCGRIWTLRRDYPRLGGPQDFRDFDEPGTVRVVYANWTQTRPGGRAAIHSETRVAPIDSRGRLGLMAVRPLIAAFHNLIATEALTAVTTAAT